MNGENKAPVENTKNTEDDLPVRQVSVYDSCRFSLYRNPMAGVLDDHRRVPISQRFCRNYHLQSTERHPASRIRVNLRKGEIVFSA
jgi:hypothetical protein